MHRTAVWLDAARCGHAPETASWQPITHQRLLGSLSGKALHYLAAQWPELVRYADDGRYPIDNIACEDAICPFVVWRCT